MAGYPSHLMRHTINVLRPTASKDAGGSPVETLAAHLTGIPAFVQPVSGSELLRGGRDTTRWVANCYVESGLDIVSNDTIYWVEGTKTCKVESPEVDAAGLSVIAHFMLVLSLIHI